MRSFTICGIWPQRDIHTHNFRKDSHASVGLAQVHPNYARNYASIIHHGLLVTHPCDILLLTQACPRIHTAKLNYLLNEIHSSMNLLYMTSHKTHKCWKQIRVYKEQLGTLFYVHVSEIYQMFLCENFWKA